MTKIKYILYIIASMLCVACDNQIEQEEIGWLHISKPTNEVIDDTRATSNQEIDYMVSITQGDEIIMSPIRFSAIDGRIPLSAGTGYTLFAESCTPTEAQTMPTIFGQPRYVGTKDFSITVNQPTHVTVGCAMANAAFKVQKDASFCYSSFTVTASCNGRTLTFTNDKDMGYFNIDGESATLQYEVVATYDGGYIGRASGYLQLKPRSLSKLVLKAIAPGSIDLSISYDDTFTPIVTEIVLEN